MDILTYAMCKGGNGEGGDGLPYIELSFDGDSFTSNPVGYHSMTQEVYNKIDEIVNSRPPAFLAKLPYKYHDITVLFTYTGERTSFYDFVDRPYYTGRIMWDAGTHSFCSIAHSQTSLDPAWELEYRVFRYKPDSEDINAVLFTEQTLTEEQKAQARANIGVENQSGASGGIPMVTLLTTPSLNGEDGTELSSDENAALNEATATGSPFVVRFSLPLDGYTVDANVLVAPSRMALGVGMYIGFIWTKYVVLMHDPTSDTWGFAMMDMSLI